MGDLTRNFSRHEFECECGCGFDTVDYGLITILQESVAYFEKKYNSKVSVTITGGNRCKEHNETVQKEVNNDYVPYSSKSTHIEAKAADHKHYRYVGEIKTQIPPIEVYNYYDEKYPNSCGVGLYSNRVHVDSRNTKARWGKN